MSVDEINKKRETVTMDYIFTAIYGVAIYFNSVTLAMAAGVLWGIAVTEIKNDHTREQSDYKKWTGYSTITMITMLAFLWAASLMHIKDTFYYILLLKTSIDNILCAIDCSSIAQIDKNK